MNYRELFRLMLVLGCSVLPAVPIAAQESSESSTGIDSSRSVARRMLVCCGLPGDDLHREQMTAALESFIGTSQSVLGVPPNQLTVLAGDETMQAELQPMHAEIGICTRETLEAAFAQAAQTLKPADAFWVVMIGHSHPYGAESQFNVSGRDFNQSDFAKAAAGIECREQVFWLTQPLSGFWIKPLSRPGRIILTATEADLEFTATEMPYALAAVLDGSGEAQSLEDVDGDGSLSLLDLYLATNLEITARFRSIDRLQTEHAQLDDNGDGRGSEVQTPYLPVEEEEEDDEDEDGEEEETDEDQAEPSEQDAAQQAAIAKPPLIQSRNLDGFRSRYVLLQSSSK
ncbi:hypothetical protein Mal15_05810 [Stieleria maiorica]|uniref:Caspase domain protein n=1 Tax=Stieleria maiorica TaxID=2795974 RepID=A0A5B9M7A9_9BACT|nr:hypothetical protein [Stieleria maiorica]QEF96553.1 hypothetical protein Mal15_05810 [Stieleria maiorica]